MVAQERTRDGDGTPVIPGLEDAGIYVFDDLLAGVQRRDMDEGATRLEGVLELVQHHPALVPEVAAIRRLCAAWWALVPKYETRRISHFELWLDRARHKLLPEAVADLAEMLTAFAGRPDLADELALIRTITEAWALLRDNPISERSRVL